MIRTIFFKIDEKEKLDEKIEKLKEKGWQVNSRPKEAVVDGVKCVYQVVCKPS